MSSGIALVVLVVAGLLGAALFPPRFDPLRPNRRPR
jgi:hypothetical protein